MVKSKSARKVGLGHAVHSVAYAPVLTTSADLRCVRTHRKGDMDHVFGVLKLGRTGQGGQKTLRKRGALTGPNRRTRVC
jgi:hypothetical protein